VCIEQSRFIDSTLPSTFSNVSNLKFAAHFRSPHLAFAAVAGLHMQNIEPPVRPASSAGGGLTFPKPDYRRSGQRRNEHRRRRRRCHENSIELGVLINTNAICEHPTTR
jgi:hypothetical protein